VLLKPSKNPTAGKLSGCRRRKASSIDAATLVSQTASGTKGFRIQLGSTLRFRTVACTVRVLQCYVCRFLTIYWPAHSSACAASSNPIFFPFEAVHCMLLLLCFSHWNLLPRKHRSQRAVIPHFLRFLLVSLTHFCLKRLDDVKDAAWSLARCHDDKVWRSEISQRPPKQWLAVCAVVARFVRR
jgi:hypothetical protein